MAATPAAYGRADSPHDLAVPEREDLVAHAKFEPARVATLSRSGSRRSCRGRFGHEGGLPGHGRAISVTTPGRRRLRR